MLEQVDLTRSLGKAEYKEAIDDLRLKLADLQRQCKDARIPTVIVFEGWDAAGVGSTINDLAQPLDPRGFGVRLMREALPEDQFWPFLHRFWLQLLSYGSITVFDGSWYGRVLGERVDERVEERVWREGYDEINTFERHLTADGYVVVKFWLHIDKKEQKRRFDALLADPAFAWKVGPDEIRRRKQWNLYYEAVEEMLERTSTGSAPWTVVESTDRRFRIVKVMETVIGAMSQALKKREHEQAAVAAPSGPAPPAKAPTSRAKKATEEAPPPPAPVGALASSNPLDRVDLTRTLSVEEYREQLPELQERLRRLEHEAYMARVPVVIVYQGWDAAGKGGNIKRLTNGMDPRGYEVVPIAAPTLDEKANHWLRRFWTRLPKAGHITIFDRSWYERILVERIEGFCTEDDWRRAYQEINEFEAALASYGTAMVKLWIHISDEEQLARFDERMNTPYKRWKITDEDWRNREKWGVYYEATGDMILRTSTTYAPWTIIEGNCKLWARIKALKTVAKAIEGGLAP